MAGSKANDRREEIKARQRYVDQPGQWVDETPKAVKARQDKALKALMASMKKSESKKKK